MKDSGLYHRERERESECVCAVSIESDTLVEHPHIKMQHSFLLFHFAAILSEFDKLN